MAATTWSRRVTVVTPRARVDVALPLQSTVAELLPQLVRLSDAERQASREHPGWVLCRLGGAPLSPGMTVTAAGLRDGDVLYLNPRERQDTPMVFDDVVDAIASAAENAPGAWRAAAARKAGLASAGVVLTGAVLLLLADLSGRPAAPIGVGAAALLLLVAGGALSRSYGDADAGAVCASAGAPAALLAGMAALAPHQVWPLASGQLALGLAALTGYGVLAVTLVANWPAWFGCLATAAGCGALAAAAVALTNATAPGAGAVLAVLATALAAAAPMLSLRLAKLPLPRVPSDIESFRTSEQPTLGPDVLQQTASAQQLLTGLLAALGGCVVGGTVALLRADDTWQAVLVGVLGSVWLLRSRSYAGTPQRVTLLVTGIAALSWLGGALVARHEQAVLVCGVAVLALAGAACLAYARHSVRGRHSPYWSRLMDTAEFLGVIALLPITGQVLDLYHRIHDAMH